jgi:protein-tyrosine phosphatase
LIDLHSHILPGVDDGARDLGESVEIAKAAVADGIEIMAATPHVRSDYPTAPDTMLRLVGDVRRALADAHVPLDVRPGGEVALEMLGRMSVPEAKRFALAGNASYLLVEFPYYGWPLAIDSVVTRLRGAGVTPVIAHPERNADVQSDPARLRSLVHAGALVQVTAASLAGSLGSRAHAAGRRLVELALAHLVASDAHAPDLRQTGLSKAAAAVGDDAIAAWLTRDVPGSIVAGTELPARPLPAERRRARRLTPWRRP